MYKELSANRHEARKGLEVNRKEGLAFGLAGEAEPTGAENRGDTKGKEMLIGSLALLWLRQGWI